MTTQKRTFAFDFDGVIAQYSGWQGAEHAGEPIDSVVEAIRQLKNEGHTIITLSTRPASFLKEYCRKHNIPIDHFNENPEIDTPAGSKPIAAVYVDDRSYCFNGQSTEKLMGELKAFQPYWKKDTEPDRDQNS